MMKAVFYVLMTISLQLVSSNSIPGNGREGEHVRSAEGDIDYERLAQDYEYETMNHTTQYARVGEERCMTDLGCFKLTKDFYHRKYRPVNFLPHDRTTIDTKFLLYNKDHPKEHHIISANKPDGIKQSPIDPKHPTLFIVHGFFDSRYYSRWMEDLKDNILLHNNFNVIIVDWSKGNGAPYTQATANTRVVGAEIAFLIEKLKELKGVSSMNCYIIGHSLGSHIAGYAGERIKKLGRITGLDPAGPYYQFMPPSVRLDPTDADFVDIIHTDSSSAKLLPLGMDQECGHVDFYPNNGMNQPGCLTSPIRSILLEGLIDAGRQFMTCHHQRAVDYFMYSFNYKKALQVSYACNNYEDYLDGQCADCGSDGKKCAILGLQADKYKPYKSDSKSIRMYITTTAKIPYWEFSYQITVKLAKKSGSKDTRGTLNLKISGSVGDYNIALTTKSKSLVHGTTYTFLVRQKEELGSVQGITFSWSNAIWKIFSKPSIYLEYIKVLPMNVGEPAEQKAGAKKFCPSGSGAVQVKQQVSLNECK